MAQPPYGHTTNSGVGILSSDAAQQSLVLVRQLLHCHHPYRRVRVLPVRLGVKSIEEPHVTQFSETSESVTPSGERSAKSKNIP